MTHWASIFDMDGVIADTNPLHRRAWLEFCSRHGMDLSDGDLERRVYGRTNKDSLRDLFGPDLAPDRLAELAEAKETLFRSLAAGALAPLAGLADFLAGLRDRGVPLAVATSAPPDNARLTLAETGLAGMFAAVVDETMVERGKPAPDVYLAAAGLLGVPPSRCVVFEDSLAGVQAARSAGAAVVGLATTHPMEELAPLADLCATDFRELSIPTVQALVSSSPATATRRS